MKGDLTFCISDKRSHFEEVDGRCYRTPVHFPDSEIDLIGFSDSKLYLHVPKYEDVSKVPKGAAIGYMILEVQMTDCRWQMKASKAILHNVYERETDDILVFRFGGASDVSVIYRKER